MWGDALLDERCPSLLDDVQDEKEPRGVGLGDVVDGLDLLEVTQRGLVVRQRLRPGAAGQQQDGGPGQRGQTTHQGRQCMHWVPPSSSLRTA